MRQTSGPGKDAGDGVGRGLMSFLVLTIMAGHCAVGSFRFNGLAIRADLSKEDISSYCLFT
jgi:hypothetical protein